MSDTKTWLWIMLLGIFLTLSILLGIPLYNVWYQGKMGEAALKRAESEKLIMIETAKAELESAKIRAEAINVVGKASKEFPEYREQEFIGAFGEAIKSGQIEQIIYVPTEANIPIIEANRLKNQ